MSAASQHDTCNISTLSPMSPLRIDSSGTAIVNRNVYWLPINHNTPKGVKLQLINRKNGVATYGPYYPGSDWTHFQGLPVFPNGDSH